MTWQMWLAFLGAAWVISLSPGAGAVASMSSGLAHGLRRGYWNILGLQLGLLLQIAVVAAGVGAVLARSATAFTVIKWFGVAYLVYLGIRQWRARPTETEAETPTRGASACASPTRRAGRWRSRPRRTSRRSRCPPPRRRP